MTNSEGAGNVLAQLSDALAAAVERAAASTVTVYARRRVPASGVVFEGGIIVTADHVIEQEEDIRIGLPDGTTVTGKLVGRDAGTDLAVIRAEGATLSQAGFSTDPRPGHIVLALGRPGPEGPVVSFGVITSISGPVRTSRGGQLEGFIRTDATFYPGFSGGPLVDVSGNVLGINTSAMSRTSGLSLPVATVQRVASSLVTHGKVRRGFLGISSQSVRLAEGLAAKLGGQNTGLLIVGMEAGGPADQSGVLVGDIVVGLVGEPVRDTDDLQGLLGGERIGQASPLKVLRGGEPRDLSVVVGERK